MELPDGATLLSVGDLTGQGVTVASGMAMLLGALRGMAVAGTRPGQLIVLAGPDFSTPRCSRPSAAPSAAATGPRPAASPGRRQDAPARCSATGRGACWRRRTACCSGPPCGAVYGQAEETLEDGDLLLLQQAEQGLVPGHYGAQAVQRLLDLAPRFPRSPYGPGLRTDGCRGIRRE